MTLMLDSLEISFYYLEVWESEGGASSTNHAVLEKNKRPSKINVLLS